MTVAFSLPPFSSPAFGLTARVSPRRIFPGDAFVVTARGVRGGPPSVIFGERTLPVSPCGRGCYAAVGSVDIKTRPGRYRVLVRQGKRKRSAKLTVRRASFPSLQLTLPEEKVTPSEEDLQRIAREADLLNAATGVVSGKAWEKGFIMPLDTPVSTVFGARRIFNGSHESVHRGTDLRGAEGDPVRAANRGTVILTEELFFGGKTLVMDHGAGIFSIYMHLSDFAAAPGDVAGKGDPIGYVGSTGRSSGPHLHFGIKVLGISTNPASLLKLRL